MVHFAARHQRPRPCETGGITILLALILLSVMTVAAFGLSRNTLREIAITGNESTGRKAFEVADSGLDWLITWCNPNAVVVGPAPTALRAAMARAETAGDIDNVTDLVIGPDKTLLGTNVTDAGAGNMGPDGSARVYLSSDENPGMKTDLTNQKQVSEVQPAFDLEVRWLGRPVRASNSGSTSKTKPYWLVRSKGRANVAGVQTFFSRREAFVEGYASTN